MANISDINIPKSPFLDTASNRPTREWLMYLLSLGKQQYAAAFSSTATQSVSAINTRTLVLLNNTDYSNGPYYVANDGIHITSSGTYNVQFSAQITNGDNQSHDADFWFNVNGVDVPNTASVVSIQGTHGGQPGYFVLAANFFVTLNAGDYIDMYWSTNSTQVQLQYLPAITTPFVSPGAPSIVITLSQVNG